MLYSRPQPISEVKAASDGAWEVAGYISTYSNVDLGGDVVMPGAFDRTLSEWKAGTTKVRFLRSHDDRQILGVPVALKSDDTGLFGRFKISRTQLGEETHQLLKDGALDSFSMGYVARETDFADNGDVRKLLDVDLLEASLVAIPMNPEAVVTGVKSLEALPFAQQWATVTDYLRYGVDAAKALRSRRVEDRRDLNPAHLATLRAALPEAEAYLAELKGLIDAAAEVEAERGSEPRSGWGDPRIELRRRRLRHAGILEPIRS